MHRISNQPQEDEAHCSSRKRVEASNPVLFQKYMYVIGHLRLRALIRLGWSAYQLFNARLLRVKYPCSIGIKNLRDIKLSIQYQREKDENKKKEMIDTNAAPDLEKKYASQY